MKNFETFMSELQEKFSLKEDESMSFMSALINNLEEGKKKKKRKKGEDEEGKAPKGYPEQKRIY